MNTQLSLAKGYDYAANVAVFVYVLERVLVFVFFQRQRRGWMMMQATLMDDQDQVLEEVIRASARIIEQQVHNSYLSYLEWHTWYLGWCIWYVGWYIWYLGMHFGIWECIFDVWDGVLSIIAGGGHSCLC